MMFETKIGASRLLIGVVVALIAVKAVVAWLSGSISVLAQAADSLLDLIAGIVTLLAVRMAARPADKEHPYGHGKWEDVAGTVQGVLIMAAGGVIIYASVRRILAGAVIEMTGAGITVMAVSIVASILLSRHLLKVARATGSVALEASARNIAADVYTASAVLAGLVALRLTGLGYIDSAVAIGVAGYVIWLGYRTIARPLSGLVDARLSPEQEAVIRDCLEAYATQVAGFHKLRTRRAGSHYHVDLHLVFDRKISLARAHEICDRVEADIKSRLPGSSVIIHPEPCDENCEQCSVICPNRRGGGPLPPR
jgi:cation diffusion facilitator family transporter